MILKLAGEHVYHLALALHLANDAEQARAQKLFSLAVHQAAPDDEIDVAVSSSTH